MGHYVVNWGIVLYARDAVDAARQALAVQRDPNSMATVFDVYTDDEADPNPIRVDLREVTETP